MTIQRQLTEFKGGLDLPVKNYHASTNIAAGLLVAMDTDNDITVSVDRASFGIKLPASEGIAIVGCLMETAVASGNNANCRVMGVVECTADGAVTAGDGVMATTAGKAKAATTGKVGVGSALTTAADGEKVLVLLGVPSYNG